MPALFVIAYKLKIWRFIPNVNISTEQKPHYEQKLIQSPSCTLMDPITGQDWWIPQFVILQNWWYMFAKSDHDMSIICRSYLQKRLTEQTDRQTDDHGLLKDVGAPAMERHELMLPTSPLTHLGRQLLNESSCWSYSSFTESSYPIAPLKSFKIITTTKALKQQEQLNT